MRPVATATEAQLREYGLASQVSSARVVRTPDGYFLFVTVSWKQQELMLYTTRNKPRSWMSVDRLVVHLLEACPSLVSFELVLHPSAEMLRQIESPQIG